MKRTDVELKRVYGLAKELPNERGYGSGALFFLFSQRCAGFAARFDRRGTAHDLSTPRLIN